MKIFTKKNYLSGFIICYCLFQITPSFADIELTSEEQARFDKYKKTSTNEAIEGLGRWIHYLGRKKENWNERDNSLYKIVQSSLLAIPGHARYYDKRIREAYEDYRDPESPQHWSSYNRLSWEMHIGYGALAELPSPEVVQILGEMLSEAWVKEETKDTYYELSSLAIRSVRALADIGLVEAPTPPMPNYSTPKPEKSLPLWQAWYEEVKAGKRWVAFFGQPLEYRFNPDGTWESRPTSHTEPTKPKFPTPSDETNEPVGNAIASDLPAKSQPLWLWLAGGILLLAAFLFLIKRQFSA